jgi:ribosomal protein L10
MATSRLKKEKIIETIKTDISSQKSIVMVSTKGAAETVDAQANFDLRAKSHGLGIKLQVIKNSLIQKSFSDVKDLAGQTYVAYLNDATDSNEVVVPKLFIKLLDTDFPEKFKVVGAIINGEFVDSATAIKYSKIPTKDESMAMIAGAINQIAAGIGRAVKAISEKSE